MLSYKALEIVGEAGSLDIIHKQIENMQKIIKSHRAALDFDLLKFGKVDFDLKQEIEIGPHKKKRGRKRQQQ